MVEDKSEMPRRETICASSNPSSRFRSGKYPIINTGKEVVAFTFDKECKVEIKIDRLQVGAPDPELKNSPILDEDDREYLSLDDELEAGVCYFNNSSYGLGDYVCSGSELLRCEEYGVWVREGDCRQE